MLDIYVTVSIKLASMGNYIISIYDALTWLDSGFELDMARPIVFFFYEKYANLANESLLH